MANKKERKDELWICPHYMEYEGKEPMIIADCKQCSYGKHDLTLKRCMEGMINAYSREYNVSGVQLNHYVETQYYGLSLDLIKQLVEFSNELEKMAMRDPVAQYFKSGPISDSQRKKYPCHRCPINPMRNFSDLRYYFTSDMSKFYSVLKTIIKRARDEKDRGKQCKECVATTIDDLNYIMDMWLQVSEQIIRSGYGVLLNSGNK